jgi:hypothetical protein
MFEDYFTVVEALLLGCSCGAFSATIAAVVSCSAVSVVDVAVAIVSVALLLYPQLLWWWLLL